MNVDALVVGGGIIGCTSAYFMALRGLKVGLIDKGGLGNGTSANSFGWVNATTKTSNEAYFRLKARSVEMYGHLVAELGAAEMGSNPTGALGVVRASDASGHAATREQFRLLGRRGYPCRWIGPDELRELEPHIAFPDDAEALLTPSDMCLDAPRFARLMAGRVRALGGAVIEHCEARGLEADDDGVITGLLTDRGVLATRRIVVAAGPDTPAVLAALTGYDGFASRFPVKRVPGLLVTTPPVPENLVRHLYYTDSLGGFRCLPDFTGGLKIASDDADGMILADPSPERMRAVALGLLRNMQALVPEFAGEACIDDCALAIGVRAYPEDGRSLAGPLPGFDGLFVIATHSGVTLAPALGNLMAEVVVDGVMPEALAPFSLERLKGFRSA